MSYNKQEFPGYVRTAGKITVLTAFAGLLVFMFAFMVDVGKQEFNRVSAQGSATTTLTVLNTPPVFSLNAFENPDSSTSTPTNSGSVQTWEAIGTDSNNAPYFLLICSTNASPTANEAASLALLGTEPPDCGVGAVQWGVSPAASSGAVAIVSTTTAETASSQFDEVNNWFAWVCDDDPVSAECSPIPVQGPTSTSASSSPFNVNNRPTFTSATNTSPVDPGETLFYSSVSDDPDTAGGADDIFVLICGSNSNYSTSTTSCTDEIASSTPVTGVTSNASTSDLIPIPTRDQAYAAFAYIFDEHGHEASNNPIAVPFTVNNVAPFVLTGEIDFYGFGGPGTDLQLNNPGGETPSSTLEFTIRDNNSCLNFSSSTEITNIQFSIFRTDVSSSTCDGSGANYDPNTCYPSGIGTTTWSYNCTATTTCASPNQTGIDYSCDFPLWFVADPTDNNPGFTPAALDATDWSAAVTGADDDFATGTPTVGAITRELISFPAIGILAADIAFAPTAPGDDTGTTNATSTAQNLGNTGIDQRVEGEDMCGTFTPSTECQPYSTSTIPADQQEFSVSPFTYGTGTNLSSTTLQEAELNIPQTSTTTLSGVATGTTYWGIAVPSAITLSGSYTGLNSFLVQNAEDADW